MKTEFNWYTELDKAIKSEPSRETYIELNRRAFDWVMGACAQLCKALPRDLNGRPEDRQLFFWDSAFADCILAKHWYQALDILNKIEARTSQLLKEQQS